MNDLVRTCTARYTLFFQWRNGLLRWIDFDSISFMYQLIECNCNGCMYVVIDWLYLKTVAEHFNNQQEKINEYKILDSIDIKHD